MITSIFAVAARLVPILLILGLGNLVRTKALLSETTIEELKGLVVSVALPAVLFGAFLEMDLDPSYLLIFVVILLICVVMYGIGVTIRTRIGASREYYPFLMTGFEFGMVGIPLFGAAYGLEAVGYIAIVDLSHELFIWFVFVTLLRLRRDGGGSVTQTLASFVRSPLIIAILAALALNISGIGNAFEASLAGQTVLRTLELLGGMLIPVILIIVGYGMRLSPKNALATVSVVVPRLLLLIPAAILLNRWLSAVLPDFGPAFQAALFTFLILPPPYVIPLFMSRDKVDERSFVNTVLSVYTAVSIVIFIVYFALNPVI